MAEREQPAQDIFLTNDYSVEVALSGASFDPDRASTILNIEPTKVGRKGEALPESPNGRLCNESFWAHEVTSNDDLTECRDHQIVCLIDEIAPHIDELREAGMERIYFYYTLTSSIGLMNIKLSPSTMGRLSSINAELYISCFDCFNPNHDYWKDNLEAEVGQEADGTAS